MSFISMYLNNHVFFLSNSISSVLQLVLYIYSLCPSCRLCRSFLRHFVTFHWHSYVCDIIISSPLWFISISDVTALDIFTFYTLVRGLTSLQLFFVLQMICLTHLTSKEIEGKTLIMYEIFKSFFHSILFLFLRHVICNYIWCGSCNIIIAFVVSALNFQFPSTYL